jgi:hypothetical protein
VQEARHEPALGVVYIDAEGLDVAGLVGGELETVQVRRAGEAGVRVNGMGMGSLMGLERGGHFGGVWTFAGTLTLANDC